MFEKKQKEVAPKPVQGWYKGYEVRWLREIPEHPDYNLVAEYEAKQEDK